jgi:lipopolysaccharide biosynthesis protein
MYWCSRRWLETVVSLGLTRDDFEPEQGQLDGTLAHGLERLIGCYAHTERANVWLPGMG